MSEREDKIESLGFVYNSRTDKFEKKLEDKIIYIPHHWVHYASYFEKLILNLDSKKVVPFSKLKIDEFIPYYNDLEFPEFENFHEIERHPIDVELLKCQSKIKILVYEMLYLVGIEPQDLTFHASSHDWRIDYDGEEVFYCKLEGFINKVQGKDK